MFGSILDRSLRVVPPNITIVPLPPKCPELNLQENVWLTVCSLPTELTHPLCSVIAPSLIPQRPGERVKINQAIEDAETRLARLEQQIAELVTSWAMAPVIEAYQAMRGVAFLRGGTFVAEIVRRFESDAPRGRARAGDHSRAKRLGQPAAKRPTIGDVTRRPSRRRRLDPDRRLPVGGLG